MASRLSFEVSNFSNEKSKHDSDLKHHYFNNGVDIIIPDGSSLPLEMTDWAKEYDYYKVFNLSLSHFADLEFIGAFVKKGQIYLVSTDAHNCIALLPTGKLILTLCKDLYEELGLQGKKIKFKDRPTKFVVEVDLLSNAFVSGRKMYEQVAACFKRRSDITFTCLVHWRPHDSKVCPSSIASYFDQKGLQVKRCNLKLNSTVDSVPVPVVQSNSWEQTDNCCSYNQLVDWAGAVMCGINWSSSKFISTYTRDSFPSKPGKISLSKWRGFVPSINIRNLAETMAQHIQQNSIPWALFIVHGFDDCPISRHHRDDDNGDFLLYVMFAEGNYWKCALL